jgi:small-conductance mechanosensitive channel
MAVHLKKTLLTLYTLLLCIPLSIAQNYVQHATDSIYNVIQTLIFENEALRNQDSTKTALLYSEISNIKNHTKQKQLEQELHAIQMNDSIRLLQQKKAIEKARKSSTGAAVTLFYDTLFVVYAPLGSFDAAQRAHQAQEQIKKLYETPHFNKDSLIIDTLFGLLSLRYQSETIYSISNIDALWLNKSVDSLAVAYQQEIAQSVLHFQKEYSFKNITIRIAYVLIVLLVLAFTIMAIQFLFKKIRAKISISNLKLHKGITVRNYQLFSPQYLLTIVRKVLLILRTILMLAALYLSLTFVFSIFPATKNWANTLLNLVLDPLKTSIRGIIKYIPNLISIAVILLITKFITRIFRYFAIEVERKHLKIRNFHEEWARPTYNIIRFLLYAFAFIILFPYLPGSHSDAFKGVSVFFGILISIGSSSAVSNIIAGLVITYMRPFKIGDWIKVKEVVGYVTEKNLLVTRLRTIHNEDITLPNSTILASHTTNFSSTCAEKGLVIHISISISYQEDWHKIHELLLQAASITPDIDMDPSPFVFQKKLDDFSVIYELNAYTRKPELMYYTESALYGNILDIFKAAGIVIMTPHQFKINNP